MSRRHLLTRAAACLLAATGLATPAFAQDSYPSRPITLIVPYAAGGSTDQLGRALAEGLSRELRQAVVVDNKPGGNGTMGVLQMKRSQPDGYTLTMVPLSVFRQPYLQTVSYHPLKDLSYIATVANYSYAIAVRADARWKTIQDLVNDAKANPDSIAYGSSALYSTNHLVMAELGRETGVRWTHVPYKGDSEALTALMGGHVQVVSSTSTVLPFAQSGKMRVLATGGETRPKDFPDVPTLKEAGYPVALASPLGIGGPAALPEAIVQKLDAAIARVLKDPAFIGQTDKLGIELFYTGHKQYAQYAQQASVQEKSIIGRLAGEVQK
jgi:tripartite-type tricarboxylate transporter receptor subunit TctC